MLAMSEVNCIKKLRNEKGLSITEIAKTMQVNWRTAKFGLNHLHKIIDGVTK